MSKNPKYWTTIGCGYCDTEFPIRKKLLKNSEKLMLDKKLYTKPKGLIKSLVQKLFLQFLLNFAILSKFM